MKQVKLFKRLEEVNEFLSSTKHIVHDVKFGAFSNMYGSETKFMVVYEIN